MNNSPKASESLTAVGSEPGSTIQNVLMPSDDQYFLLYFIMGTFFGPDLRGLWPPKSVLQRLAEGLPPYTSEELACSHVEIVEIERVYYYALRKANRAVIVKLPWLHQFFYGNLPTAYPQFPDLFPPQLHPRSQVKNRDVTVGNILFINNPEIFYFKPEDIERFKRLTGLENLLLDSDGAKVHNCVNGEKVYDVAVQEVEPNGELPPPKRCVGFQGTESPNDVIPNEDVSPNVHVVKPVVSSGLCSASPMTYGYMAPLPAEVGLGMEKFDPGMLFLPSPPTKEEWEKVVTAIRRGSSLTGTAAMGQIGPAIGQVDIGESEDSYLFRVSLPGVKRDDREFSCEVENDGKVLIRGVTTAGDKTVYRHFQEFEMQTQNLCPSGHFSISFKLPGSVDPQRFSGNFGTDGILEGIVMKGRTE